jgi:hypothetical protein
MKWTTRHPTRAGWYWFESERLNIGARIVHVTEECGSVMVDDYEFDLYDNVDSFEGANWSTEPVPEPEGTPVIERVMFKNHRRAREAQR